MGARVLRVWIIRSGALALLHFDRFADIRLHADCEASGDVNSNVRACTTYGG